MNSANLRRGLALAAVALLAAGCGKQEAAAPLGDYQRVAADGAPYQGGGDFVQAPWSCVYDRSSGLMWEVKASAPGLRFRDNTYTWYDPKARNDTPGVQNGGACQGSGCDTLAYVAAVNAEGLCGYQDWRLPSKGELTTLNQPGAPRPGLTIDTRYFPDAHPGEYWSASTYTFHYSGAWVWNFQYGFDRVERKESPRYVRLVRGSFDPALAKEVARRERKR